MKNSPTPFLKFIIIYIFLFTFSGSVFAQFGCKATLVVDKNANIGTLNNGSIYYPLVLSNTGNQSDSFTISAVNINGSCKNNDLSDSSLNVNLSFTFLDKNLNLIQGPISLLVNESILFYVKVDKPTGTNVKRWNCTQIEAKSSNCSDYKTQTDIQTFVLDPNED